MNKKRVCFMYEKDREIEGYREIGKRAKELGETTQGICMESYPFQSH